MKYVLTAALLLLALALCTAPPAHAAALLPDIIVEEAELELHYFDTGEIPGRTLLRFQSSLPNIGPGEFIIRSTGEDRNEDQEFVEQEIRQTDGPSVFREVPGFYYNTRTLHMDAFNWVAYRIREILPGDGVGEILRTGQKPSVRLVSSRTYDSSLPNYVPSSQRITFNPNTKRMGISVGWTDIYTASLELQWIDVSGLKQGTYWLEVEVDFGGFIEEANENNNLGRIKVTLEDSSLPAFETHRADTEDFGVFRLNELLRVIQLYNVGRLGCAEGTEDGFEVGGIDTGCQPHSSDYAPQNWSLSLSELLRAVQLFSLGPYQPCEGGEDGFCSTTG